MNTRKNTLRIRLASLALFAFDVWLPSQFPSALTALLCWLLASMALVLVVAPNKSRFAL
jgi:hypothetical protein